MVDPFDIITAKRRRLLLPWECGFAGLVFRSPHASISPVDQLCPSAWDPAFVRAALANVPETDVPASSSSSSKVIETLDLEGPAFRVVGRKRDPLPWSKKVTDDRQLAMARWKLILEANPSGSRFGLQLMEAAQKNMQQDRIEAMFDDVFSDKATKTLEIRAGSLILYTNWRRTLPLFRGIFPFVEHDVYDYLSFLRIGKAPASRGTRLRESIGFSHGVLGALGAEEVLKSRRCQGAASRSYATKGTYTQRDPLTVHQLQSLEGGVFSMDSEFDKIMCGNVAALTHVRGRSADVHYCNSEPYIDDCGQGTSFFEIPVMETKVTRKDKKRRVLPLVGHATGLTGAPWCREWLRLRKAHGLNATGGPLMVAITSSGKWTSARLRSQEGVIWTRSILAKLSAPILEGQRFGMHSCKVTLLSWCAKAAVDLEHRNTLGYHSSGAAQSSLLYARDAFAGPLRSLEKVLIHIRSGRFHPDQTRSGRWDVDAKVATAAEETEWYKELTKETEHKDGREAVARKHIPGIDDDQVSMVSITSQEIAPSEKSVPAASTFEEVESDGFEIRCPECEYVHASERTIYTCDRCEVRGCSTCMLVVCSLGSLLCYSCHAESDSFCIGSQPSDDEINHSDSSDSSESEEENSSSEHEADAVDRAVESIATDNSIFGDVYTRRPARNPDDYFVQHVTLKTLHLKRSEESETMHMVCGRVITDKFEIMEFIPVFDWPRCKICFGSPAEK